MPLTDNSSPRLSQATPTTAEAPIRPQQPTQPDGDHIAQVPKPHSRKDITVRKASLSDTTSTKPTHRFPWLLTLSLPSLFDWLLKILAVVIAVLFGIWAPLSYNATADGNRENNEAQEGLAAQLRDVETAANTKDLERKLDELSLLRVWEFCETRDGSFARERRFEACAEVVASASSRVENLISSIVGLGDSSTATASPTDRYTPPPVGDGPRERGGGGGARLSTFTIITIALVSAFVAVGIAAIVYRILTRRRRARRVQEGDAEDGEVTNGG